MSNRKFRKVIVYVMIFAMLASTLAVGLSFVL
ncbi:stressosome-associated protein Prli42 [Jeotgalibacillus marinus]|uniref:Stressosome-associated protein Prli42 n=1 Tax=Jeotgalibacillus marinus TaxID=86667 RepID=A0ABV3PZ18_9BACL